MLPELRITGRRSSHFTRVVTMLAHELALPYELDVVSDLTSLDPCAYGGHPALKLPTLHVGATQVLGTANICRTLVALAGRAKDPRVVLAEHVEEDLARNAQELVWQAMALQVQLVVGVVLAHLPAGSVYFAKAGAGLTGALAWLEQHLDPVLAALPTARQVSVFELTLFCLFEHLGFRPTVPLAALPRLRAFTAAYATRESARQTAFRFDAPSAGP